MQVPDSRDDGSGGSGHGGSHTPANPRVIASVKALMDTITAFRIGTADRRAVRAAIATWRHEVHNSNAQPEQVLIAFKSVLEQVPSMRARRDSGAYIDEYRELTRLCIEEYYGDEGKNP